MSDITTINIPQYDAQKMPKSLTPVTIAFELKSMQPMIDILSNSCPYRDCAMRLKMTNFAINEIVGIANGLGGELQEIPLDKPEVKKLDDTAAALLLLGLNVQWLVLKCDGIAYPTVMGRLLLILTHLARIETTIRCKAE